MSASDAAVDNGYRGPIERLAITAGVQVRGDVAIVVANRDALIGPSPAAGDECDFCNATWVLVGPGVPDNLNRPSTFAFTFRRK